MNKRLLLVVIFLLALIFSRFYNLGQTSRFLWDESSDLVKIHQYWIEKNFSLIGPISQDGSEVFSSLTYLMLLPFAVLGNFDLTSTTVGAAFWGSLTAMLIVILTWLVNKKLIFPVIILTLIWYPLLQTSRWAWNPNLIPFWIILGLCFYQKKKLWSLFLSGLFLGLTGHHHYLSVFAVSIFTLLDFIWNYRKKTIFHSLVLILGLIISILPFIIFDLTHAPGLFISRILYFNHLETSSKGNIFWELWDWFSLMLNYFTQNNVLAFILGVTILVLVIKDIKDRSQVLIYGIPWIGSILALSFVKDMFSHYLIPTIGFFLVWLIYPRKIGSKLAKFCLVILIIGGLFSFIPQISKVTWETDKQFLASVVNTLETEIKSKKLENVNIATLESPDINRVGQRYRDLLLLDGFKIKDQFSYSNIEYLFVITTSDVEKLRRTNAPEMGGFRNGEVINAWGTIYPEWKIYLFRKNR